MADRQRFITWIAGFSTFALVALLWLEMVDKAVLAEPEPQATVDPLRLLESTSQVFESVANVVSPAVAYIEARVYDANGKLRNEESGSGVLIRPKGADRSLLLTNCHVVGTAKPDQIDIYLADGRLVHPRRVWRDEATDLALLDPGIDYLPAAKMGDSDDAKIGQWVLVIGSPFGLSQSVTHGILSATHRRRLGLPGGVRIQEFLQTDAAINPGNSGGPLVNLRGEVIGINSAIASNTGASSGVGFSIPINIARWVIEEFLTHGKVRPAFLGVEFPNQFSHEQAKRLGLDVNRGALVARVHPGTPADSAGIRPDDVVLVFNQIPVEDEYHLINMVSLTPSGSTVEIVVWRDRQKVRLQATLTNWESFQSLQVVK